MKSYLIVTGSLFALLAVLHAWRIVVEWHGLGAAEFWIVAAGTVLPLALAGWAWKLLADLSRRP